MIPVLVVIFGEHFNWRTDPFLPREKLAQPQGILPPESGGCCQRALDLLLISGGHCFLHNKEFSFLQVSGGEHAPSLVLGVLDFKAIAYIIEDLILSKKFHCPFHKLRIISL